MVKLDIELVIILGSFVILFSYFNNRLPSYYNSEFKTKSKYNQRTLMQDVVDDVIFLKNTPKSNNQSSVKI